MPQSYNRLAAEQEYFSAYDDGKAAGHEDGYKEGFNDGYQRALRDHGLPERESPDHEEGA